MLLRIVPLLITPIFLAANGPSLNQSVWVGDWRFEECWKNLAGTSDCIEYRAKVRKQGDQLVADVEGDGFQTYFRVQAVVKQTGNRASFVFSRATEEGLQHFKPGDVLFELHTESGIVFTKWEWLQASYKRLPSIQFERVKGAAK